MTPTNRLEPDRGTNSVRSASIAWKAFLLGFLFAFVLAADGSAKPDRTIATYGTLDEGFAAFEKETGIRANRKWDSGSRIECVGFARAVRPDSLPATTPSKTAKDLWTNAVKDKWRVGQAPVAGSVMCWKGWQKNTAGHVALVTDVAEDGTVTVWDANWSDSLDGKIRKRIVSDLSNVLGYVYAKDTDASPILILPEPTRDEQPAAVALRAYRTLVAVSCKATLSSAIERLSRLGFREVSRQMGGTEIYNGPTVDFEHSRSLGIRVLCDYRYQPSAATRLIQANVKRSPRSDLTERDMRRLERLLVVSSFEVPLSFEESRRGSRDAWLRHGNEVVRTLMRELGNPTVKQFQDDDYLGGWWVTWGDPPTWGYVDVRQNSLNYLRKYVTGPTDRPDRLRAQIAVGATPRLHGGPPNR